MPKITYDQSLEQNFQIAYASGGTVSAAELKDIARATFVAEKTMKAARAAADVYVESSEELLALDTRIVDSWSMDCRPAKVEPLTAESCEAQKRSIERLRFARELRAVLEKPVSIKLSGT